MIHFVKEKRHCYDDISPFDETFTINDVFLK